MELWESITDQNPHWEDTLEVPPKERRVVELLDREWEKERITALVGPRQVGKSTALKQLIKRHWPERERVLYYSFDLGMGRPVDVFKEWVRKRSLNPREGRYVVMFDEVQWVEGWGRDVKYLYDTFGRHLKLYVSGSSSAYLKRGKESLAGRSKEITLSALTYGEYLHLTGKVDGGDSTFVAFLGRQFPWLALGGGDPKEYVREIVEKAIKGDLSLLYGLSSESVEAALHFFHLVASSPGSMWKLEEVAGEVGVSRQTLASIVRYLEEAMLIRRLYNAYGSVRKSRRKLKKYYPFTATLSYLSFPRLPEEGLMVESYVAEVLSAQYFWRKEQKEVDFILGDVGVEVKWRRRYSERDVSALLSLPLKRRIVVGREDTEHVEGVEPWRARWVEELKESVI